MRRLALRGGGRALLLAGVLGAITSCGDGPTAPPAPVAALRIAPVTDTVWVGDSLVLTATALDSAGDTLTGRAVTWTSSDTTLARVRQVVAVPATPAPDHAFVAGLKTGTATITATAEGVSDTVGLTVLASVDTVRLQPVADTILAGEELALALVLVDPLGNVLTDRTATWTSSDTTVARVHQLGSPVTSPPTDRPAVTGLKGGAATITASCDSAEASVAITVLERVAVVRLEPAADTVWAGDTFALAVTLRNSLGDTVTGRTVAWTSSDSTRLRFPGGGASLATRTPTVTVLAVPNVFGSSDVLVTASVDGIAGTAAITVWFRAYVQLENLMLVASGRPGEAIEARVRVLATSWGGPSAAPPALLPGLVAGAEVAWSSASGGGTVAPERSITDVAGEARTAWTLGPQLGYQAITATFSGRPSLTLGAYAVADSTAQLAFVQAGDIYLLRLDDRTIRRLTTSPSADAGPSWAPTGDRIAFTSDRDGNSELYVMRADGSDQTRLTFTPENEANPAWSPDGRWIAVSSDSERVRLVAPDGSRDTTLTSPGAREDQPSWSPDGTHLVVVARCPFSECPIPPFGKRLDILDLRGGRAVLVEAEGFRDWTWVGEPAWSPDGSVVAYTVAAHWFSAPWVHYHVQFRTPSGGLLPPWIEGREANWSVGGTLLAYNSIACKPWVALLSCPALGLAAADASWTALLAPSLPDLAAPRWRPVPGTRR